MSVSPLFNLNFINSCSDAVVVLDTDFKPIYFNPSFDGLVSDTKRDISELSINDLLHPFPQKFTDLEAGGKIDAHIIANGLSVDVAISDIQLSNGSVGKALTIRPTEQAGDTETSGNALVQDLQGQLMESEKNLQSLKKDFEELTYVVSHDLQGPMRTVASYVQLVLRDLEKPNASPNPEFLKFISEGIVRLQSLLGDLLLLSRIDRKAGEFGSVDLNGIVTVSQAQLKDKIAESGATVSCNNLPSVFGDTEQLLSLFKSLIDNAIKFRATDRKPEIKISVEDQGPLYLFAISDNGIGIDEKHYNRIFVIFQKLHGISESEGTGAGLAFCKKIVERHGGKIWIQSVSGEGSTFYFTLKKDKTKA